VGNPWETRIGFLPRHPGGDRSSGSGGLAGSLPALGAMAIGNRYRRGRCGWAGTSWCGAFQGSRDDDRPGQQTYGILPDRPSGLTRRGGRWPARSEDPAVAVQGLMQGPDPLIAAIGSAADQRTNGREAAAAAVTGLRPRRRRAASRADRADTPEVLAAYDEGDRRGSGRLRGPRMSISRAGLCRFDDARPGKTGRIIGSSVPAGSGAGRGPVDLTCGRG